MLNRKTTTDYEGTINAIMTNYEQLFQEQMKTPDFAKAFHEVRLERVMNDMLERLEEQIVHNTPKEAPERESSFQMGTTSFRLSHLL